MLTDKQYNHLLQLDKDKEWIFWQDESGDDVMRFLLENNLVRPRADIAPDHYELTQLGEVEIKRCEEERRKTANEEAREKAAKFRFYLGLSVTLLAAAIGAVLAWVLPLLAGTNGR